MSSRTGRAARAGARAGAGIALSKIFGPWLAIFAVLGLMMGFTAFLAVSGVAGGGAYEAASQDQCAVPGGDDGGNYAADLKAGTVPDEYVEDVKSAAKTAGMPASHVAAEIESESQWNPKAVSGVGARGISQFMPSSWETYGHGADPFDAHAGIKGMGEYLRDLKKQVQPVVDGSGEDINILAMASYNAGPGAILQYGGIPPYAETEKYVANIKSLIEGYKGLFVVEGVTGVRVAVAG